MEIKNIPVLRFHEFEGEWESRKFGDISEIIMGQSPNSGSYNFEGEGEFLIQGNADIFERKSNPRQWTSEPTKKCQIGDILFTVRAPVGYVAKSVHNACIGRGVCSIKNTVKSEQDFLYQFLLSYELKWKRIEQGSTFTAVSGEDIKNITIVIPTLPEQQKIASFFTAIDQKISQLKKKHQLLEQYKKGVMQQIFSQQIRFKDDDGREFPKWEKKRLGDVAVRTTEKNKVGNQNVLTISAQQGLVSQLDFFNKSVAAKDLTGYYLLKQDDFAYNKSYSTGYPMGAVKRLKLYEYGVVSTLYICFRFLNTANLSYIEQYFESGLHNREIEKVAQEGARNHGLLNIGVNDFFNTIIKIPTLSEQTKIANFLSAIDDKINHTIKQIEHAEVWKKGLMQQMFV